MTPDQIAELEKLDAQIAASPDVARLRKQRGIALAYADCDFALSVADFKRALETEKTFERRPGRFAGPLRSQVYLGSRSWWKEDYDESTGGQTRAPRANAVAYLTLYVETAPDLARWRRVCPSDWDAFATLQRAAQTGDAPKLDDASIEELKIAAMAAAMARRHSEDARLYVRALKLEITARRHPDCAEYFARRARNRETADFVRRAWWQLAIEAEPDNPKWHAERGRFAGADKGKDDLARAIELAPDDPYFYELRAKIGSPYIRPAINREAAADYQRALELRLASGQILNAPEKLAAQGARIERALHKRRKRSQGRARAFAFYSVAIAGAPGEAAFYLERARIQDLPPRRVMGVVGGLLAGHGATRTLSPAGHEDYLRALCLNPSLGEAREAVTNYLVQTLADKTGHERLEGLLDARQSLIDAGINATLARAIVGEVEAALAS